MRPTHPPRLRRALAASATAAVAVAALVARPAPASAGTSSISGTAFEDANRNGAVDAGEALWANQQIYLFDGAGAYVAVRYTDAAGAYSFGGLADGTYSVEYASPSLAPIQMGWTPTTTGSWRAARTVQLVSEARVDFGWRPIVRSTNLDQPIATYRAPNGLTVQMYNDAVAPQQVAQLVAAGPLVGAEAASITVRVDGSQYTATGSSYAGPPYSGYAAIVTIDWLTWLNTGENALFHEYGHAWSGYWSVMIQQDPRLAGYLQARGLTGDPRVDSTYGWSRYEMIAEDYRQLFGTPAAAAGPQANGEAPPAASVAGLRDYLATAFRQAPAGSGSTTTTAPTPPAVAVSGLAVSPRPVSKSGTVAYSLNQPATVTVAVTTTGGTVVRTLVASASQAGGSQSLVWDRKDAKGRRVASGTYTASVTATAGGSSTKSSVDFPVA